MGEGLYNLLIRQQTLIYHWFNIFYVQIRLNGYFALLFTIFCLLNTGFKWTHYTSFGILICFIILKDNKCGWKIWWDIISFIYFPAFHLCIFTSFLKVNWNNCTPVYINQKRRDLEQIVTKCFLGSSWSWECPH